MKKFAFLAAIIAALAFWRKDSYKSDAEKVSAAAKGAKDKVAAKLPNRGEAEDADTESSDADEATDTADDNSDEADSDDASADDDETADADATS